MFSIFTTYIYRRKLCTLTILIQFVKIFLSLCLSVDFPKFLTNYEAFQQLRYSQVATEIQMTTD